MKKIASSGKYVAYPEYKDSGIEWLGNIPSTWKLCRLKFMAKIKNGQDYKAIQVDEGYPVMGSGGQFTYASKYMYNKESVLLGRKGTIDKPLYINEPFWSVDTMYYTEINKDIHAKYLYYLALTIQFDRYSTNTALPSMTQEHLGNFPFAIPDREEDREQIANFLDHETAKIDSLIEKQQQLIKLLKEKRQAVTSHAVTKGLNPDAVMKDSGVEWLGEVPEHWAVAQLKFNTLQMQTGPFGSQLHAEDYVIGGVPLINPAHMIEGNLSPDPKVTVDDETQERLKRHKLSEGEIIFARRGELGRCAIVTKEQNGWLCGTGSLKAKLNKKLIPEYAYLLITSDGVVSELSLESKGSTMDNLNTETLGRVRMPVPPKYEQNKILEYVENISGKYKHLINSAVIAINLIQERRTALISAAVTGKIDVRNWSAPRLSNIARK
ncbi:MAG: type I restriction enzyme S subunit [Colwellia sp.]|jgi:type I restriction enzyme S subunit